MEPVDIVVPCLQPIDLFSILPLLMNTFRARERLFEPASLNMGDSEVGLDASADREDLTADKALCQLRRWRGISRKVWRMYLAVRSFDVITSYWRSFN